MSVIISCPLSERDDALNGGVALSKMAGLNRIVNAVVGAGKAIHRRLP